MKQFITLLLAVALATLLAAAVSVTVETKLARIQTDPNASDDPIAYAYFEQKTVVGDQTFVAPWVSVSWRLKDTKTVTLGGTTMSYAEVSAFVTAIAEQEYAAK